MTYWAHWVNDFPHWAVGISQFVLAFCAVWRLTRKPTTPVVNDGVYHGGPTPAGAPPVSPLFRTPDEDRSVAGWERRLGMGKTRWTLDCGPGTYRAAKLPATGEIATFTPVTLTAAGQITITLPVATTATPVLIPDPPDVSWIEFQNGWGKTVKPPWTRRQTGYTVETWGGDVVRTLQEEYREHDAAQILAHARIPSAILSSDAPLTDEQVDKMAQAWRNASRMRVQP